MDGQGVAKGQEPAPRCRRVTDRDRVGILVPPPAYPLAALAAGWALQRWLPLPAVPPAARVAGAALAAAAVAVALWAVATLVRHRTPLDPYRPTTAIVRAGPYAWSRNPIYLAFAVGEAGIGLALGWWWPLALAPLVLLLLHVRVVRREEAYLARKFGAEYEAYRQRTRRWI